jgi:hypothetical protein
VQEELKAAALRLAAMGLRVFPLNPGEKTPAISNWPKLATTDPAAIERVWSRGAYNIGVAMGQGWLGLDIDMKHGKDGLAALDSLGVVPQGFVVGTPSGGRHVYYRGPDLGNSAGRLGDGLDLRGVHGYLVGPGSVVEAGAYAVLEAGPPADVPAVIVQRSVAPRERAADAGPLVTADRKDAVDRAIDYLGGSAPAATEGSAGDLTTFKVAATLKDYGVSQDMAVELMAEHWNDRCDPPWPYDELQVKVRNAYEYGALPLGVDHPASSFGDVKIAPPPAEPARQPSQWFRHGDGFDIDQPWLFYGVMPQVGTGVLVAPSQAGKTFLAIEAARCGATGKPFFGVEPDLRFGTLFVFGGTEGSGFAQRLAALGEDDPLPISGTVCGNLAERGALSQLLDDLQAEARRILAEFGVPVRLVVLETLAASGLLIDENSNSEASMAMTNLAHLGRQLGAFVWTSHHPAKDGKGSRGASAIPSSADYVMEISRHGQARELELTKARNAEQRTLGSFTLLPVELGTDARGRKVTSRVISTGEKMTRVQKTHAHAENVLRAIEWALTEDSAETVNGRPAALRETALEQFGEVAGGSYRTDKSNRKKAFDAAVAQLADYGRVAVEVFAGSTYYVLKETISG